MKISTQGKTQSTGGGNLPPVEHGPKDKAMIIAQYFNLNTDTWQFKDSRGGTRLSEIEIIGAEGSRLVLEYDDDRRSLFGVPAVREARLYDPEKAGTTSYPPTIFDLKTGKLLFESVWDRVKSHAKEQEQLQGILIKAMPDLIKSEGVGFARYKKHGVGGRLIIEAEGAYKGKFAVDLDAKGQYLIQDLDRVSSIFMVVPANGKINSHLLSALPSNGNNTLVVRFNGLNIKDGYHVSTKK